MRRLLSAVLFLIATSCLATAPARAAETDWPTRPVTVIVASAAGGSADVLTRLVLNRLSAATGATFVVENRPGAAGSIGMMQITRAKPDGYTLGYGNINTLAVNPALFNKLPYDANKDFVVVGRMFDVYNLLVVSADSPARSVNDLIALAKSKPGGLSYGAAGIGSSGHMGGELFKHMAGVDAMFVPYNGDPASLSDLAGGRIDYSFTNASVAWPLVQSGKLRALAITSRDRVPFFPDLPTLNESGLSGYENVSWGGLVFPRGTPDAIVQKLSGQLQKVLASDGLRDDLSKLSARPGEGDREAFVRYIAAEQRKWADLIDAAHIEKQN
ncbi:Bug family tripartite tricarboxylate transporter substrate binding protein [Bordetella genomosp. 13]|uniref:Bug family tripartite tricarboxylate transporter substrate binding protein n=1 Tax=Bordetella genomosp. 13 TaxID=463040 RepID=UPI0021B6E186|nr:tripartite tricarboxylate transporter substrate binding protein [Bordetella genomosp. 13]